MRWQFNRTVHEDKMKIYTFFICLVAALGGLLCVSRVLSLPTCILKKQKANR